MTDEKNALEHRHEQTDAQFLRAGYYRADYVDGYPNGAEDEGVQVDWVRWARAIFRRKWLIVAVVAIGTALSLLAAFRTRDAYQAYAVISDGKEDAAMIKFKEGDLIIQNDIIGKHCQPYSQTTKEALDKVKKILAGGS